jgi:hypothetical protein
MVAPEGTDTARVPSYDELPVREGAPPHSSWGLWGDEDRLGCLNLLTAEKVREGLAAVRHQRVFSLDLPLGLPDPPLFNRARHEHRVTDISVGHDEILSNWNPQSGSQWDGFRHVRHPRHGFYAGLPDERHGVHHWAKHGIATRGVLVDVARWRDASGRPIVPDAPDPITVDDLRSALEFQRTGVRAGDVLLVRTGWMGWYKTLSPAARVAVGATTAATLSNAGLQAGRSMAAYLWNLHLAALAADNPAIEVWPRGGGVSPEELARLMTDPDRCEEVFLHFSLIPLLGLPLGELWNLEDLARDCAGDETYDFLLVSAPLGQPGGVSSPANAVAIR